MSSSRIPQGGNSSRLRSTTSLRNTQRTSTSSTVPPTSPEQPTHVRTDVPDSALTGNADDALQRLGASPNGGVNPLQLQMQQPKVLTAAQQKALAPYGLSDDDKADLLAGKEVVFTLPAITEDETIGTLQLKDDCLRNVCVSVHDEKAGLKALMAFRSNGRDLARAFGKSKVELGGAAVINDKIERLLNRQGFAKVTVPVPDGLGNVDDMELFLKTFELDDK